MERILHSFSLFYHFSLTPLQKPQSQKSPNTFSTHSHCLSVTSATWPPGRIDQVQRVLLESCVFHSSFPCKLMKLKRLRAGKVDKLRIRCAVDMNLPVDRAQRREIIGVCGFDPWQAHVAVDFAGFVFAQEAATVIDVDLRQHFKCIS